MHSKPSDKHVDSNSFESAMHKPSTDSDSNEFESTMPTLPRKLNRQFRTVDFSPLLQQAEYSGIGYSNRRSGLKSTVRLWRVEVKGDWVVVDSNSFESTIGTCTMRRRAPASGVSSCWLKVRELRLMGFVAHSLALGATALLS